MSEYGEMPMCDDCDRPLGLFYAECVTCFGSANLHSVHYDAWCEWQMATIATEPTPIGEAAHRAHTLATLTADYWQACGVCGAVGSAPCRDGGRFVRRHGGRS